MIFDGPLM